MKLKFFVLFFFISYVFLGSQQEEIELQISDEKMIKILTDLHISEAAILSLNQNIKDSISVVYYQQIFEIHGVQDSIFYQDLEILRKDSKRLEKIYQKVLVEIEQLDLLKVEEDSVGMPSKKNK